MLMEHVSYQLIDEGNERGERVNEKHRSRRQLWRVCRSRSAKIQGLCKLDQQEKQELVRSAEVVQETRILKYGRVEMHWRSV